MSQAPARFSFVDPPDPPALSGANQLPIRRAEEGSQIRFSYDHYLEICQARVDDARTIKNMRLYIELQHQTEERLNNELVRQRDSIVRLQHDRRDLLSALREIHEAAPDREPLSGDYLETVEFAEQRGYEKGAWDAGEIARQAIDKVGAEVRVDIPRRRAS
jgi:hypothetical protein